MVRSIFFFSSGEITESAMKSRFFEMASTEPAVMRFVSGEPSRSFSLLGWSLLTAPSS